VWVGVDVKEWLEIVFPPATEEQALRLEVPHHPITLS
jgi:hypothetical protein